MVTSEEEARKLIFKPNFRHRKKFTDNFLAFHMKKTKVKMNEPSPVGAAILELSKVWMYRFLYKYIKPKWGDKVRLLYTDTDSFILEIETDDFYADINPDLHEYFGTSNYPVERHLSGIEVGVNKKVIGMFKDECGGKQITEFVSLRSKQHSFKI